MSENIIQLENILSEELRIFSIILRLEREKSDAIINKDGKFLQKLSQDQESYLSKILPFEKKRKTITEQYSKTGSTPAPSVSEIALMEGIPNGTLKQISDLLKKVLIKINALQDTNNKMINDNIDFFKKMIHELRQYSNDIGYSDKGTESSNMGSSFLVDRVI